MDVKVKINGLDDALAAMRAAFPKDPKQQKRLLNASMKAAARDTILPIAKVNALQGDGSGALSESLAMRTQTRRETLESGAAAGVKLVSARRSNKAIAMYINHYYVRYGFEVPDSIFRLGIRHGHLVEFGTKKISAMPFLWPAAQSGFGAYISKFAGIMKKKVESAVKRRARKAKKGRAKKK
jgi:hypothetical protein